MIRPGANVNGVLYANAPGYEWRYLVGTDGSVWSRSKRDPFSWCQLKPQKAKDGRLAVMLFSGTKASRKRMLVHRLVLLAFFGPCPPGMESRHLNDVPTDNRLANLAWGTHVENCKDRDGNGGTARGSLVGTSTLREDQVRVIRLLAASGLTHREIAERFGITRPHVSMIMAGRRWGWLK